MSCSDKPERNTAVTPDWELHSHVVLSRGGQLGTESKEWTAAIGFTEI